MDRLGCKGGATVVVVVDDDDAVRDSLKLLLETDNIEVLTYASGEEFLSEGLEIQYDCVMLDIHLPGVSGFHVLRQLVARGFRNPVILMTARPSEAVRLEAERAGALTLMLKPLDDNQLFDAIYRGLTFRPELPASNCT
jgi:FixJ family two-component response regulator